MPTKSIPARIQAPDEGYPGNLNPTQLSMLREMWREWHQLLDQASGDPRTSSQAASSQPTNSPSRSPTPTTDQAVQELLATYSGPEIEQALWDMVKMDDPDQLFCRFLRARKWDLAASMSMLAAALKWRMDQDLESLIRNGDYKNSALYSNFGDNLTSGKSFAFGSTIAEQPVTYVAVKKHLTSGQPEETIHKYILSSVETFRLLMVPPGKVTLVFDLTGFGLKNMDWQTTIYVLSVLEKYYPESLGTLYVMNAPWIFSGFWKGLAPMLDPVVQSKIKFISSSSEAADNVPHERFLASLGGEADFTYMHPPAGPDDDAKLQDTETYKVLRAKRDQAWIDFAVATQEWCNSSQTEIEHEALTKRKLESKKIRIAHFDMEPYYRPQTVLDRSGVVDRRGLVKWSYPQQTSGINWRQVCGRLQAAPTLRRELNDVKDHGLSLEQAEAKSVKAIEDEDWITLYGSRDLAIEIEGEDNVRDPADSRDTPNTPTPTTATTVPMTAPTLASTSADRGYSTLASTSTPMVAGPIAPTRPSSHRRESALSIKSSDSFASAMSEVPEHVDATAIGSFTPRRLPGKAYRQIGGPTALEVGQDETTVPPGTPGNLSHEQEQALRDLWAMLFRCKAYVKIGTETSTNPSTPSAPLDDNLKQALDSLIESYQPDALERIWDFIKMDDPDSLILRFLRARKWDVTDAVIMAIDCIKWRMDYGVENLVQGGDLGNGEKYEKYLEQQRVGKTYALGTTSTTQQPICYIHVAKHLTSGQPPETMEKFVVASMETFRLLMSPPQEKATLFFDLTGFGLRNMDWNTVGFIIKCFESFYPECLGTLFVHNAPWLFSGIWHGIAPMLDPVVRSKVIFSSSAKDCADIVPPGRLLAALGGKVDNGFKFVEPVPGENTLLDDQEGRERAQAKYTGLARKYEKVTKQWIDTHGEDPAVVHERAILVKQLRVAQFDLEPYVRGQTVYHRNGTLDGQGKVTWLYRQNDGHLIRHVVGRASCVGTLEREIVEMQTGSTLAEVHAKTVAALRTADWLKLYGDPAVANHLEGTTYPVKDAPAPPVAASKGQDPVALAEAAAATAAAGVPLHRESETADSQDPRYRAGSWSQAQPSTAADTVRAYAEPHGDSAPAGPVSWTDAMTTSVTGMATEFVQKVSDLQDFALNAPGTLHELLTPPTQRSTSPASPGRQSSTSRASRRLSSQLLSAFGSREQQSNGNESPATASLRRHQRSWSSSWFTDTGASHHQYERISTTADLQAAAAGLAEHLSGAASEWTYGLYDMVVGGSNPSSPVVDRRRPSPVQDTSPSRA